MFVSGFKCVFVCVFGKVISFVCERQQVLFVRFSLSAVI